MTNTGVACITIQLLLTLLCFTFEMWQQFVLLLKCGSSFELEIVYLSIEIVIESIYQQIVYLVIAQGNT